MGCQSSKVHNYEDSNNLDDLRMKRVALILLFNHINKKIREKELEEKVTNIMLNKFIK
jgi:hypothetical protein